MPIFNLYCIVFLVTGIITLGFAIYTFIRTMFIVFNYVYVLFAIGTILVLGSYIVASGLGMIGSNAESTAEIILASVNTLLTIGLCIIALGIFYVRREFFEVSSITIAFLSGIMLVTVTDPDSFKVKYNPALNYWEGDYNLKTNIKLTAIGIIVIIFSSIYLYQKLKYAVKTRKFSLTILGLLVIIFWLGSMTIKGFYYYRIFLLCLGIFLVALANSKNPLSLLISVYPPNEIILFTDNNLPLVRYDIKKKQTSRDLAELNIIRVSEMLLKEKTRSESIFHSFHGAQGELVTMKVSNFFVTIIGRRVDHNIKSAIALAIKIFSKKVNFALLQSTGILKEEEEEWFKVCVEKHLSLVNAEI